MRKTLKKGFTLTELIIVIVIIAILLAIFIPLLTTYTKKARIVTEKEIVRNLNIALKNDEETILSGEKHKTMYDALKIAEQNGYSVEKINNTKTGNEILWDSKNDVFCYLNGEDIEYIPEYPGTNPVGENEQFMFWRIAETYNNAKGYSVYLAGKDKTGTYTITTGLDVGENTGVIAINYDRTNDTDTNAHVVVIRTNGGNLSINGEQDVVKHYGIVDIVEIQKIAPSSYHEFGTTGSLSIEIGHVEVEQGGYIAQATVTNGASLTVQSTGKVAYLAASEMAIIEGTTITTTQKQVDYVQVDETNRYTYLENNIEKTALFVSTVEELNSAFNGTTDLTGISKVVLANDLTINHTTSAYNITVKTDATLDLNGKTIICNNEYKDSGSSHGVFLVQSCDFRIVDIKGNGKIVFNNTLSCNSDLFIVGQSQMTKNTTLILDSGILEFNSSNSSAGTYCIDVMDNHASYTAAFIMNGGSILCKDSSGGNNAEAIRLYDNGNSNNVNRNCYVEINNGYITGDIYFQMGMTTYAHMGEDTLVINGGTIIAKRPIRSTQYTANSTNCWGYAVITLNGGNIIATEGFGSNYISYNNIIGTSYGDVSSNAWSDVSSWTAKRIFNITDNR